MLIVPVRLVGTVRARQDALENSLLAIEMHAQQQWIVKLFTKSSISAKFNKLEQAPLPPQGRAAYNAVRMPGRAGCSAASDRSPPSIPARGCACDAGPQTCARSAVGVLWISAVERRRSADAADLSAADAEARRPAARLRVARLRQSPRDSERRNVEPSLVLCRAQQRAGLGSRLRSRSAIRPTNRRRTVSSASATGRSTMAHPARC